jgi:PAS domain S-box-containing protein
MATILVVDDRPTNRKFLTALLGYSGHRMLEATDGAEALTITTAERPDLIIADVLMPTMDGYELVRLLREDPVVARTPVIFYTAHYREQEAQALARACGVSTVLIKPAEPQVVLRAVEATLGIAPPSLPAATVEDFDREHMRLVTGKLSQKVDELKRTNQRLSALVDLGLEFGSELDLRRLLQSFSQAAREIIGARYAIAAIMHNGDPALRHVFTSGMNAETAARLGSPDPDAEIFRLVVREGHCLRIHNPGGDVARIGLSSSYPPVHALVVAPIESPTRIYGWLSLIDKIGVDAFSEEDERLASILAAQVGRIYQNGSLYADALKHASNLEREMADRKEAEQRQAILLAVSQALAESSNLRDAAQRVLSAVCTRLKWVLGSVWAVDRRGNVLRCLEMWQSPELEASEWKTKTRAITFEPGIGLPGRVWRDGQPIWIADVRKDKNFARGSMAAEVGIRAAFAFPILSGEHMLGVIEVFSERFREPDKDLLQLVTAISSPFGQFIERKQADEALKEAEDRVGHVVSSIPSVLYTLSGADASSLRLTWISRNVQEMMGYEAGEVYEPGWWDEHVHREDLDRVQNAIQSQLFVQGNLAEEYRFLHHDGKYRWIRSEMRLLRGDAGLPLEVVGTWSDITDRKKLDDQFPQVQKMEAVGQSALGLAHDFNNLLTVITGYSEIALASIPVGDPLRELIEHVQKAGRRAASLTRQLLEFSRKQVLVPRVLDLSTLLKDIEKMLSLLVGEEIDLQIISAGPLWRVKMDAGQMEQVIMNLVVNASDAMLQGGKLTIETANVEFDETYHNVRPHMLPGQYVMLAVSDNGCGMEPATKARIFEPFFTTKGPEKGTGLGLATVWGIVKQSGGHFEVYSEVGVGTTIKIFLPRTAQAPETESEPDLSAPVGGAETILLIENDEGVRSLVQKLLKSYGYTVLEAANKTEALVLAQHHEGTIHLIVSDIVMPNMSGHQLAKSFGLLRPEMKIRLLSKICG